ncbi:hypothetical protein AMTRI_Chr02g214540 [Amborella trichopoda]|uniref:uncharacterized protein LOC18447949 n=1 Tax=Amborella trichopoda TaxID=13333 RepID=UPI0005D387D3|nr:uncharacterized protein LOC18447949 [Amborella trichopoda]|eukprot:XP_011628444.1 uncharacterized protein LOC18447949 [Amborella trichopoda]
MAASCNLLSFHLSNSLSLNYRIFPSLSSSKFLSPPPPQKFFTQKSGRSLSSWSSFDETRDKFIDTSLRNANIVMFNSGYNVQIVVDDDEPEEVLLRRFRREVMRAGVIQECKRRRFFENKNEEKKRKAREAGKRNRRRRGPPRNTSSSDNSAASKRDLDDGDDNWDLPVGDLPY